MLEILDEEDRALLILKYAESYDYEELAAIFQLSVSACKMRISRAREKLQERYQDQPPQARKTPWLTIFCERLAKWKWRPRPAGVRSPTAPPAEPTR